MNNKKEDSSPDFKSEFLAWSEFRQLNFVTLIFLSDADNHAAVKHLLTCLDACSDSVLSLFIRTIFTQFSMYKTELLDYVHKTNNPAHIRLLMIMHIVSPHHLDDTTIDSIIALYFNPHDTHMEPVVETFIHQNPELTLPNLIKHALKPTTAIRSRALLAIMGQQKIKAILGNLNQMPKPVRDCIGTIPLNPRPIKTPEI